MRAVYVVTALALLASPLAGQDPTTPAESDSVPPRRGSEFLIPAASLFLPGLGQLLQGAPSVGLAHLATAVAGTAVGRVGDPVGDTWGGELPRRPMDQLAEQGEHVMMTAVSLSAWDAFHRAVPALQRQGKYEFLGPREHVGDLISAPFDHRFLRRWTTWVDLAQSIAVAALILSDREAGAPGYPFRAHDAAWVTSLSMNAAVGEEALFRGWLLPLAYQHTGQRFWVANGLQAGLFGAAHLPDAGWLAVYIGGWAAWEGWIVRRNGWSIRESIFHHFWYDVAVISAALLTEEREAELRVTFPTIRF